MINPKLEKALKDLNKILSKKTKDFEYDLLLQYKKTLEELRTKMFKFYEKYGIIDAVKEGELKSKHFIELSKYNRLEVLEKQIAEEIKKITGVSIDLIGKEIKNTFKESYSLAGDVLNDTLSFEIKFQKLNPDVIAEAVKNPFDRVKWQKRGIGHHEAAINQVKTEITQGLIQGKGYAKTAANITEKVNNLANNMTRIVRTESHRVQVLGNNSALDRAIASGKRLGIELVKTWVAINDGKSKDRHHEEMNNQQIGDDGMFTYPDGNKTELPGSSGIADHDIHCRCSVIVKLKEDVKK